MTARIAAPTVLGVVLAFLLAVAPAWARPTYPPRIGDREFILDKASLISPEDQTAIKAACSRLLDERGIPLVVVTIPSLEEYGASGWPMERYAMNLFDEWGLGRAGRNTGVLLLVSKGDRKVRIELGAGWSHDRDVLASSVIGRTIVPRFKSGQFSQGIRAGVEAFAAGVGDVAVNSPSGPARGSASTSTGAPGSTPDVGPGAGSAVGSKVRSALGPFLCVAVGIGLIVVMSIISRIKRALTGGVPRSFGGAGGLGGGYGPSAWGGGGGLGGLLPGLLLGQWLGGRGGGGGWGGWGGRSSSSAPSSSSSDSYGGVERGGGGGGGGFSGGGSFGGGFSGGGGSTGSW